MSKVTIAESLGDSGIAGFNKWCEENGNEERYEYHELVTCIEDLWEHEYRYHADWLREMLLTIAA